MTTRAITLRMTGGTIDNRVLVIEKTSDWTNHTWNKVGVQLTKEQSEFLLWWMHRKGYATVVVRRQA